MIHNESKIPNVRAKSEIRNPNLNKCGGVAGGKAKTHTRARACARVRNVIRVTLRRAVPRTKKT